MAAVVEVRRLTYSVPQMAAALGISKPKAYELVNRQDFPKIRVGTKIVVPIKEFEQWVSDEALREAEQWEYQDDDQASGRKG